MEFKLSKASEGLWNRKESIVQINTLEDLKNIQEIYKYYPLIIDFSDNTIQVYDDYIE